MRKVAEDTLRHSRGVCVSCSQPGQTVLVISVLTRAAQLPPIDDSERAKQLATTRHPRGLLLSVSLPAPPEWWAGVVGS